MKKNLETENAPELTIEMVLDSVGEGIFGVDLEGNTTFCNRMGANLLGYQVKELLGNPQHDLVHHSYPNGAPYHRENCPIYAAFKDGLIHHSRNEVFWKKDGTSLPVEYYSRPIFHEGKKIGAVVTYKSIELEMKAENKVTEILSDLRQREQELKSLFDTVPDGIITISEKGVIQKANRAAEVLFGYTSEELLGSNIKILMPNPYSIEHDDYLKNYRETGIKKVIGKVTEVTGLKKDGSLFPIDLGISEMVTEKERRFVGIVRDKTEIKRAIEAQERLASVVENTDDAVIGTLLDGTISLWNQAAKRIFGYGEIEIVGKHISILVPPDHQTEPSYLLESVKRGQTLTNFETQRKRKDGTLIDVALTVSSYRDSMGKIVGVSSIARNIQEQKKLLQEKEDLIEKLEAVTLTDSLTNLRNRRGLTQHLEYELARFQRNKKPFSILMVDIDHFKKVNDSYGHAVGDHVLIQLARKLKINTRQMDTICRWGGEEFLILLVETDLEGAKLFAEKIRSSVEQMKIEFQGHCIPLTVSIGVNVFDGINKNTDNCLKIADDRLYSAKSLGRNRVVSS